MAQRKIGIMVDDVKEVKTISSNLIEEKPDVGGMNNVNFISGIARLEDEMLIILDVDKLLSSEERMSLEQVMKEA